MTACRDIVTDAFREIGSYANEALSDADEAIGMRRLNALMNDLAGMGIGERLRDIDLAQHHYHLSPFCMPRNVRLLVNDGSTSLSFPDEPENGSRFAVVDVNGTFATSPVTIARNGRKVEGQASDLIANTANFNRAWMYRADLADWRCVDTLVANSDFPLDPECEEAFTVLLSLRLAPTDGMAVSAETISATQRATVTLRGRHRQTRIVPVEPMLQRRGFQSFPTWTRR